MDEKYTNKRLIGKGGFATVYEVKINGKKKAIKKIEKKNVWLDQIMKEIETIEWIKKFYPECTLNLLCYDEIIQEDNYVYLISDLMEQDLFDYMNDIFGQMKNKMMNLCDLIHKVYNIGYQVLNGLESLHSIGILHNDIKPENILVSKDDVFGLGCIKELNPCQSNAGSPEYSYPDKFTMDGYQLTSKDDIHALAIILYVIISGEYFYDLNDRDLMLDTKYVMNRYKKAKVKLEIVTQEVKKQCKPDIYKKMLLIKEFLELMLVPYPIENNDVSSVKHFFELE
jgi:serine/threonine protein kinase